MIRSFHPNLHVHRLIGMALVTLALSIAGAWVFNLLTPAQHNPFRPLDLAISPGLATSFKLGSLDRDPAQCFALLDQAGVAYTHVERPDASVDCSLKAGLTLDRSLTPYSATLTTTCRVAAALYIWERHVVRPAAELILGQEIKEIETVGSYSCRRRNSAKTGRWSEHAHGDAIDISGFVLADGSRVSVKDSFGKPTREGVFLKEIRDRACSLFSATLSPDYNKLHHDHLHLDMGADTICS